jgi:hypothetical protein
MVSVERCPVGWHGGPESGQAVQSFEAASERSSYVYSRNTRLWLDDPAVFDMGEAFYRSHSLLTQMFCSSRCHFISRTGAQHKTEPAQGRKRWCGRCEPACPNSGRLRRPHLIRVSPADTIRSCSAAHAPVRCPRIRPTRCAAVASSPSRIGTGQSAGACTASARGGSPSDCPSDRAIPQHH